MLRRWFWSLWAIEYVQGRLRCDHTVRVLAACICSLSSSHRITIICGLGNSLLDEKGVGERCDSRRAETGRDLGSGELESAAWVS